MERADKGDAMETLPTELRLVVQEMAREDQD
jgi:hypothetical protein